MARVGFENSLSESVVDEKQRLNPTHLDFTSWPAIAGDHSTSPRDMLKNILETEWILDVADIAARLKIDLEGDNSGDNYTIVNALRNSDIRFQRTDPEYATRAGSNDAHFLLSLDSIDVNIFDYIQLSTQQGAELNAIGIYAFFHYSALIKASVLSSANLTQEEYSQLALAALADLAFALHFLEDVFASGHVAGTWGDASQRKGTHDFYNELGLKTNTWLGESIVLTGDAYMRNEDAERAAQTIKLSIEQFLNAVNGNLVVNYDTQDVYGPDRLDVGIDNYMPNCSFGKSYLTELEQVIVQTPVPGLADGAGALPRFRSELGLFAGSAGSLRGSIISEGFGIDQNDVGLVAGIETALRFGIGLDGVLNESGDGLAFLEVGWRQDRSSTNGVIDGGGGKRLAGAFGSLFSAVPGRSAYSLRLRAPFYLLPGDLIVAAPLLYFLSPQSFVHMGTNSVNGGLLAWQSAIATPIGKFQFVLGREIAVYFFGKPGNKDAIYQYIEFEDYSGEAFIVSYRSIQFEIPVLEYTPLRTFSFDQSSTLHMQLYAGLDMPYDPTVPAPQDPVKIDLEDSWYMGLKLTFDWVIIFKDRLSKGLQFLF